MGKVILGMREFTGQMLAGLLPHKLKWQGVHNGVVKEKRLINPPDSYGPPKPCLVIRDEEDRYCGFKIVSMKDFQQAKVGQIWRRLGFVTHSRFHLAWIVTCEDPVVVIRQIVLKSWGMLTVVTCLLSLFVITCVSLVSQLFSI